MVISLPAMYFSLLSSKKKWETVIFGKNKTSRRVYLRGGAHTSVKKLGLSSSGTLSKLRKVILAYTGF